MKNEERALALKRLILYLFFAFIIAWVPWIILNETVGYENWFTGKDQMAFMWLLLISGGAPAIANILTRIITKESWRDSMLHLRLRGNVRYYFIALLIPMVCGLLRGLGATVSLGSFSGESSFTFLTGSAVVMQGAVMSCIMAFNTFGEEFGWRGYMNPKMEALFGKPVTIVAGGIIWGVWHAPLTVCGHNFGTDYWGFPWLGIVMMSIFCIGTGIFLMWLTDKTSSIFPAAIAHSANNNGSAYVGVLTTFGVAEDAAADFGTILLILFPMAIVYAAFGLLMMLRDKKQQTPLPEAAASMQIP